MKTTNTLMKTTNTLLMAALMAAVATTQAVAKPLKVYILAGQSNMQGKAHIKTLPAMAADPASKELHDKIVDGEGQPREFKDIRVSYLTSGRGQERIYNGPLVGFGEAGGGPELTFGITMHEHLKEPILLIKTAWGGKSLNTNFRPPSAGPFYPDPSKVQDRQRGNKPPIPAEKLIAKKEKHQHVYYHKMMEHIKTVLADPGTYHPEYDPKAGYEIAGFVWFQGFNDKIGGNDEIYKATADKPQFAAYSDLMAHFIRDVRKDLNAPKMPFVIGVLGIHGEIDGAFQNAQAAPAEMPEFKGNVAAVRTGKFWDKKLGNILNKKKSKKALTEEESQYLKAGKGNAPFHYLGSAKIYGLIGEAFAKAMIGMSKSGK